MRVRRVALIVLDGLGIGAMPDAGPDDAGSHTLRHVLEAAGGLRVPNLAGLGLGEVAAIDEIAGQAIARRGAHGAARLAYPGADTYLGHQELMGAPAPTFTLHMLADRRAAISHALEVRGHRVRDGRSGASALLVDDVAIVADNIEAAPGLNINVTGSLDETDFNALLAIGRIVRQEVSLPRVIVVGGRGFRTADILGALRERATGHVGVDTPGLGVYDEHYVVRHLGLAGLVTETLPTRIVRTGREVVLLGKAADVVESDAAMRSNEIETAAVLSHALRLITPRFEGLIVANIQETDLAGHEQDASRYRRVLEEVDRGIPGLIDALGNEGLLFVAADHGNDPTLGHSRHTRELAPVLVGGDVTPAALGVRDSLADVAATIAAVLGAERVAQGESFAHLLGTEAAAA